MRNGSAGNFFQQPEASIRTNVTQQTWNRPRRIEPVSAFLGAGKSFLTPAAIFSISPFAFWPLGFWHVSCKRFSFASSQGVSSLMSRAYVCSRHFAYLSATIVFQQESLPLQRRRQAVRRKFWQGQNLPFDAPVLDSLSVALGALLLMM